MFKENVLYYVAEGDMWAWSPDGVGCYWYESEAEARDDAGEDLTYGGEFLTDAEFEDFREAR